MEGDIADGIERREAEEVPMEFANDQLTEDEVIAYLDS